MITRIGEILKEIIPDFVNLEIIYGEHYLHDGYDEKNHMLLIRNCIYCYEGCPVEFEIDLLKIQETLEKELPLTVKFDKSLMFDDGLTYKFYLTINDEAEETL